MRGFNKRERKREKGEKTLEFQLCFGIMYRRENQRQYELRADTVSECKNWIDAIKLAR